MTFFRVALTVMLCLVAACAANTYETAGEYRQQGEYAKAAEKYGQVIADPADDREMMRAYYFRGRSYEDMGDMPKAYADYVAATQIACYVRKTQRPAKTYTAEIIAGSYCTSTGPRDQNRTGAKLNAATREQIKAEVMAALPAKFK